MVTIFVGFAVDFSKVESPNFCSANLCILRKWEFKQSNWVLRAQYPVLFVVKHTAWLANCDIIQSHYSIKKSVLFHLFNILLLSIKLFYMFPTTIDQQICLLRGRSFSWRAPREGGQLWRWHLLSVSDVPHGRRCAAWADQTGAYFTLFCEINHKYIV